MRTQNALVLFPDGSDRIVTVFEPASFDAPLVFFASSELAKKLRYGLWRVDTRDEKPGELNGRAYELVVRIASAE
jgi:hypothetical protein